MVDDDAANRTLAVRQLAKFGLVAKTAQNGREAVEAVGAGSPALIFMDLHMPEMDGLAATRSIRSAEGTSGRHVPILAMTASATEIDRIECLEAGMDGFLAKPVMLEDLATVIIRWLPEVDIPYGVPAGISRVGLDGLRDEIDPATLSRLADLYLSRLRERQSAIREAIERQDPVALRDAAHALRSAASVFSAEELSNICAELEELGRSGTTEGATGRLDALRLESERVANAVAGLRMGGKDPV